MKRELWPAYLVLLASVVASFAAASTVGSLIQARALAQFNNSAEQWTRHVKDGLRKYWALLDSVRALTVAHVSMNLGQFGGYVKALELQNNYRGITGLGIAVKIASAQRGELERQARQQGIAQFHVWPSSSEPELCPVVALEPPDASNLATLGFDLFAEPQLQSVAKLAAERGKSVATEMMSGIFKGEAAQRRTLFVLTPIYRGGGLPETVEERRGSLMGIVLCAFEPVELFQTIANTHRPPNIDLRIYSGASLIYETPRVSASARPWKTTQRVSVAGREWGFEFSAPAVGRASMVSSAGLTLLIGLVISGLMCAITATQIRARTAAEQHAAQIEDLNVGLEQRVADRTAQLEGAVEDLKAFSYSVSHDLRAPLRHIDGYVSMLKENSLFAQDPEFRFPIEGVSKAAKSMSGLVEGLLKFAHIGHIGLALTPEIDVKEMVLEVRGLFSNETKHRKIEWILGELPRVTADRMLLRQVFANLIANAIKYSSTRPEAIIEINGQPKDGEVVFSVRDNGVGFDMKYADRLFGVFQRLHRSEDFEGTGIGLANVRKIISRHGGRTWAESQPDRGAVFYFTLPQKPRVRDAA